MYTGIASEWLSSDATISNTQADFLNKALLIYETIARQPDEEGRPIEEAAAAWLQIAKIQGRLYKPAAQRNAAGKAIARYQVLLTNEPLQALTLAECYQQLSRAQVSLGDHASAYDALEQARQQLQTLTPQQLEETTILELLTLNDLDRAHVLLPLGRLDEATQSARRGARPSRNGSAIHPGRNGRSICWSRGFEPHSCWLKR